MSRARQLEIYESSQQQERETDLDSSETLCLLQSAIDEQKQLKESIDEKVSIQKLNKIATGTKSDVIPLCRTGYRNHLMGCQWWCANDQGKAYLSIMRFRPIENMEGETEYEAVDFDKRIALTLEQFSLLNKSFPDIVKTYYQTSEKDEIRIKDAETKLAELQSATETMREMQKKAYGYTNRFSSRGSQSEWPYRKNK